MMLIRSGYLENGRTDAGRGGQTCLARPNSQARTKTGEFYFPDYSADREQDWQPFLGDAQSAIVYVTTIAYIINTVHRCIYTYTGCACCWR